MSDVLSVEPHSLQTETMNRILSTLVFTAVSVSSQACIPMVVMMGSGMMGMGMMNNKEPMGTHPMMQMSMKRHHYVMNNGIPQIYLSMKRPLQNSPAPTYLAAGRMLYDKHCAVCHGAKGVGDGVVGETLQPAPTNLAMSLKMPQASDPFVFWAIAEGGAMLQTAMPPFKDVLTEQEIWQLIAYLRSL